MQCYVYGQDNVDKTKIPQSTQGIKNGTSNVPVLVLAAL